jgi:CD2 antigen cytoplasmic tail-binding protein 2
VQIKDRLAACHHSNKPRDVNSLFCAEFRDSSTEIIVDFLFVDSIVESEMANLTDKSFFTTEMAEENRKKVRIDPTNPAFIRQDQEEQVDEFEEDIGLSKKGIKRKNVRTDVDPSILELCAEISKGYDSDSSQEGDSKKKRKKKPNADDEDDMFTEPGPDEEDKPQPDDEDAYGKLKRKQVKFVDYTKFEGQEVSDEEKDVDDEEESVPSTPNDSDDEIIDEEVGLAGSKKHAPKIEKFNLRQETAEGAFTEDGGYIRKAADPRAHQDTWLDGLTKGAIQRAADAAQRRQEREEELEKREWAEAALSKTEVLERLIRMLPPGETPLEALARLNQTKKKKWQLSQKWKRSKMMVDMDEGGTEEDAAKVKEQIEGITAYADRLLSLGSMQIYSLKRERMIMSFQDATQTRFKEDPAVGLVTGGADKWEYKWPGTEDVHTGFSSEEMKGWKEGGFFGDGVLVRSAGSTGDWQNSAAIVF